MLGKLGKNFLQEVCNTDDLEKLISEYSADERMFLSMGLRLLADLLEESINVQANNSAEHSELDIKAH